MYEKILKIAEKIAREIHYEAIYGTSAGGGSNRWILANGTWNDEGIWMDDKHWKDG